MTERVKKLLEITRSNSVKLSTWKASAFTKVYKENEDKHEAVRTALAQAYVMDNIPLDLMPGDLIIGNPSAKRMGIEVEFWSKGVWKKEGIESLREEGDKFGITDEDAKTMLELSEYWEPRNMDYKALDLYDKEMWRWRNSGFLLPACKNKDEAAGSGFACNGFNLFGDYEVNQIDYGYVMNKGIASYLKDAEDELERMYRDNTGFDEDIEKIYVLQAAIIQFKALLRYAARCSEYAEKLAEQEKDEKRRRELLAIAENCKNVPANKPRTFHEAMQSWWFIYLMIVTRNTTPIGRFDQYMYPYYKADIEAGRTTDEEIIELLEIFRCKHMQMRTTSGGAHRKKWSGNAKWNNMVIGGVKPDGSDASNELSYLVIEAAMRCPCPHHTISLRVSEKTPDSLMLKALQLVRTGIGMPAFLGDKSYIAGLLQKNVPIEKANDYYVMGCIDVTVPEGFGFLFPTVVMTVTLDSFLHNGRLVYKDKDAGIKTGDPRTFATFEELMEKYKEHVTYYYEMYAKDLALKYFIERDHLQDPFPAMLFTDGIKVGKIGKKRTLPYGLGPTMNVSVGTINVANSLYAIKKLVYEDKVITMDQLLNAMDSNWAGEEGERIHKLCLAVPKYGNNNEEVDAMAAAVYNMYDDICESIPTYRGGTYNTAGVSITGHEPGGAIVGATPDGRYAGQILADGAVSPVQATDTNGPTAVINSAMKIDQSRFMSLLFNMKISPSSLKTDEDLMKLAALIRVYFNGYGKMVQFNVVSRETLESARKEPEKYPDLIVRVAGYSAYYTLLSPGMQSEIVNRTVQEL